MDLSGYYTEALDWTCRLEGVGWPPDLVLYWQGSCLVLAHQIRFEAVLLLWAMPMSLPQIIAHTSLKVVLWGIWQIWQKDMIVNWLGPDWLFSHAPLASILAIWFGLGVEWTWIPIGRCCVFAIVLYTFLQLKEWRCGWGRDVVGCFLSRGWEQHIHRFF